MHSGKPRLRGLVIAPFGIVPANQGSRAHTDAHIRQLKALGHEIWYLGAGTKAREAKAMKTSWQDRFIHARPVRRRRFIKTWLEFKNRGMKKLGIPPGVDSWFESRWLDVARELMARVQFDYLIVHYIFLTRFFEAAPPGVRKIIDTHDSFGGLGARLAAQGVNYNWWHCSERDEIKALVRGDQVMANQWEEGLLFERHLKGARPVVTVGHRSEWAPLPEAEPPAIGIIASYNAQNQVGLAWFIENCWPLIRAALPQVSFIMAGLICERTGPWTSAPGVRMLGCVDDPASFHRLTTVEINPVAAGSGLKIKTIESLAAGRALVSVAEGVAGIPRDYGAFVVADEAETFAGAVIRLLQDPAARASLVANARLLINDWNERQASAMASLFEGLRPLTPS